MIILFNNKIKSGIIIRFYSGALVICGLQYLGEEERCIENTFKAPPIPNIQDKAEGL